MKLQILVPQYNETEWVIKPLLDSISTQRGINLSDIGVIIVNDGADTTLNVRFLKSYPYRIDYYKIPHKGVSAARNAALRKAEAPYVMFCDADDKFFSDLGLWYIIREIDLKEFDILRAPFIEEINYNGEIQYSEHPNDPVFIHGQTYRKGYLIDNDIWWNENLHLHEDANFNGLAFNLSENIRMCKQPFYLWVANMKSVARKNPDFGIITYADAIRNRRLLLEETEKRKKDWLTSFLMGQMIFDGFKTALDERWKKYPEKCTETFDVELKNLYHDYKKAWDDFQDKSIRQHWIAMYQKDYYKDKTVEETEKIIYDWIDNTLADKEEKKDENV